MESYITNTTIAMDCTLTIANKYNNHGKQEIASNLSNYTQCILDATRKNAIFIYSIKTAKGSWKGISNFSDSKYKLINELTEDPVAFLQSAANSIKQASIFLGRAALLATRKAIILSLNPDDFFDTQYQSDIYKKEIKNTHNFINNFTNSLKNKFNSTSYEEKVATVAEFGLDLIFDKMIFSKIAKTTKAIKAIKKAVNIEIEIIPKLKTLGKRTKVLCKKAFCPFAKSIKKASKHIKDAINKAKEIVKFEPFLEKKVKKVAIVIHELKNIKSLDLLAANKSWGKKAFEHIFKGEYHTHNKIMKLVSGLHTPKGFQHFLEAAKYDIKNFKITKLKNGIWRVKFPEKCMNRLCRNKAKIVNKYGKEIKNIKTLWPEHYKPKDILNASNEIIGDMKNFVKTNINSKTKKIESYEFKGLTKNNILATIYVDAEAHKITTAYPNWVQSHLK